MDHSKSKGAALLGDASRNRSTAFSASARSEAGLEGLLPAAREDISVQIDRVRWQLEQEPDDLARYRRLMELEASDEYLFYAVLGSDPEELLSLVYTPTVGEACEQYSRIFVRPGGLYLDGSGDADHAEAITNWPADDVRAVCITSGERILGLGDLGVNGIGIAIGKLQLYTACADVPPTWLVPSHIDFGTGNEDFRADPFYLGLKQDRVQDDAVDAETDRLVAAIEERWPGCLIHFEDWAGTDALRLLDRYSDGHCVFNDDIQGTGAMVLAGIIAAAKTRGDKLYDQRLLFFGAGAAAIGIARVVRASMMEEGMSFEDATARIAMFDIDGFVTSDRKDMDDHLREFAHDGESISDFVEAIETFKPTAIIGVSGVAGAFDEKVIGKMAEIQDRPIIFALSNPTPHSEATAQDAYAFSEGRALFASGSPFDPVDIDGKRIEPAQANNMTIFPGLGLAVTATRAKCLPHSLLCRAAHAVAGCVSQEERERGLLFPPNRDIRETARTVAAAVTDRIFEEGLAGVDRPNDIEQFLDSHRYNACSQAQL